MHYIKNIKMYIHFFYILNYIYLNRLHITNDLYSISKDKRILVKFNNLHMYVLYYKNKKLQLSRLPN